MKAGKRVERCTGRLTTFQASAVALSWPIRKVQCLRCSRDQDRLTTWGRRPLQARRGMRDGMSFTPATGKMRFPSIPNCSAGKKQIPSTWDQWAFISCRSEEHTSELQSIMRISYAVFCLKKKKPTHLHN